MKGWEPDATPSPSWDSRGTRHPTQPCAVLPPCGPRGHCRQDALANRRVRVSIGDAHAPLTARWTSCLPPHLSPARELPGPGVTPARGHPGVEGLRSPLTNQERCSEGGVVWREGVVWQRPEGHPSCCLVCRLTHLCLREPLAGQVPSWPWCPRGTGGSWPGVAGHLLTI